MSKPKSTDSLASFAARFAQLFAPPSAALAGRYRGEIVGPRWLRLLAPPGLAVGGLRGWWGKEFDGVGGAVNLVARGKDLDRVLPMRVDERSSKLDGRAVAALSYPPGSRPPWRWIVDELRLCDDGALLGMTVIPLPLGRRLCLPFLLRRD